MCSSSFPVRGVSAAAATRTPTADAGGPDGAPAHFEYLKAQSRASHLRVETVPGTKRLQGQHRAREARGLEDGGRPRAARHARARRRLGRGEMRGQAAGDGGRRSVRSGPGRGGGGVRTHDERRFPSLNAFGADEFPFGLKLSIQAVFPERGGASASSRELPRRARRGQAARRVRREGNPRGSHPKTRGGSQTDGEPIGEPRASDEPRHGDEGRRHPPLIINKIRLIALASSSRVSYVSPSVVPRRQSRTG